MPSRKWPAGLLDLRSTESLEGSSIALAYSGGPDATALAARLKDLGAHVTPVYVAYRNFGGKTAKDLRAAKRSAKRLGLSTELIDGPLIKRITAEEKSRRNRIILEVISAAFADGKAGSIALGTYQDTFDASGQWTADSNDDIDPAVLAPVIAPRGHKLVTWDSFGVSCKADEFRNLSEQAREALFATVSCQMWWKIECGNCYSCIERHDAFMAAFGRDPTRYRPGTNARSKSR